MRTLLLFTTILLSAGVILLAYLFMTGVLNNLLYTLCSSAISILLIFALFHFIYLYLTKQKQK